MRSPAAAHTATWSLEDLREPDYNPNVMDERELGGLRDSIREFGLVEYPVVNVHKGRRGVIVGGSHRVRLAREDGAEELPCVEVDLTLVRERELNLRLNKHRGRPQAELIREFFDLDELAAVGYTQADLEAWDLLGVEGAEDLEVAAEASAAVRTYDPGPAGAAADRFADLATAAAAAQPPTTVRPPATPTGFGSPAVSTPMSTLIVTGPADQVSACRERLNDLRVELETDLAGALYHALIEGMDLEQVRRLSSLRASPEAVGAAENPE